MASETKRQTENGILGLLAGGVILVLAIWIFAFSLSGTLAGIHMRHKVQGISMQVAEVLREAGETLKQDLKPQTRAELRRLMKYREVARMEIADAAGRVIWSSDATVKAGRIAAPAGGGLRMEHYQITSDGLSQSFARSTFALAGQGFISLDVDMTGLLAWYERISFMVAKALTAVVIGGFLVMGTILFGKYRERAQAETRLEALRRQNAEEQKKVLELQAQLEELNAGMARLNRKLAGAMQDGKGARAGKAKSARKAV